MDDDHKAAEQAVAGFFHASRADRKKGQGGKPRSSPPMHHRANTDWWNFVNPKR